MFCTSGTAAANHFPAVVEASMARVPIIVMTADRPPELHGVGANQTIDQQNLFGGFVKWFHDTGVPVAAPHERHRWAQSGSRRSSMRSVPSARSGAPEPAVSGTAVAERRVHRRAVDRPTTT